MKLVSRCNRTSRLRLWTVWGLMCLGAGSALADDLPRLAIGDASAAEPPVGSGVVRLLVSLSAPAAVPVTATFETIAGTATAADFNPQTGILEIPAGATRAMIRIPVLGDAEGEEAEEFFVRLSQPQGAELGRARGRATILNTGNVPVVHAPGATLYEDGPATQARVHLGSAGSAPTTLQWQLQRWFDGPSATFNPATPGADFDTTPGVVTGSGWVESPLAALSDTITEPSLNTTFVINPTELLTWRFESSTPTAPASFVPGFLGDLPDGSGSDPGLPFKPVASTDGTWIAGGYSFPFSFGTPAPTRLHLYRRTTSLQRSWEVAPPIELGVGNSPVNLLMRRGRLAVNTLQGLAVFEAPEGPAAAAWTPVNLPPPQGSRLERILFNAHPFDFAFDGDTLISVRAGPTSNVPDVVVFHERLAPTGAWTLIQEEPLPETVRLQAVAVDGDLAVLSTANGTRLEEWRRTGPADRPWVRQGEIPSPPPQANEDGTYGRLALAGGSLHARRYARFGTAAAGHLFRCSQPGQWQLENTDLPARDESEPTVTFLSPDVLLIFHEIFARTGPRESPWQRIGLVPLNPLYLSDSDLPLPLDAQGGVLVQDFRNPPNPPRLMVSAPGAAITLFDDESAFWSIGPSRGTSATVMFEPEAGTGTPNLSVYGPLLPFPATVGVRTIAGGTATPGVDYTPVDTTVYSFATTGFDTAPVDLAILADRAIDPDETLLVELHSPSYGRIADPNPATITIRDFRSTVTAASPSVFLSEPATGHLDQGVDFQLSLPVTTDITVPILFEARSATPETDFLLPAATVTVPAGARSFVVPVRVLADALKEPVESFALRLGNSGLSQSNSLRVQVNILDRHLPGLGTEPDTYAVPQNAAFSAGGATDPAPGVGANDPGFTGTVRLTHPPDLGAFTLAPTGSFTFTPPPNAIGQTQFAYEARLGAGPGVLVDATATWRYLHPLDGVDPAVAQPEFTTAWRRPEFDDSTWTSGVGTFGYGGLGAANAAPDVAIGTPPTGQRYTAYFRHRFNAPESLTADLELQFSCDDAVILYLNGAEIGRFPGPGSGDFATATDTYKLLASGNSLDGAEETRVRTLTVRGVPLAATGNLLAASVHNTNATSSDLGFRFLSLNATEKWSDPTPVTLTITDQALPPRLSDDSYFSPQHQPLVSAYAPAGGLYANDSLFDRQGRPYDPILELEISPTAAGGEISASPLTGEFQYTPPAGYYGPESFTYRVRDKDGWSQPATVTIGITPSNGYDQWRRVHLGAATPTPETEPDQSVKNNGLTNLESYHFLEDEFPQLPVSPTPLTFVHDGTGRTGVRFTSRPDSDALTIVEASSTLRPDDWQTLARWQGFRLLFVAPGATLDSMTLGGTRPATVLESAPPPGPRYYRVRLERPAR